MPLPKDPNGPLLELLVAPGTPAWVRDLVPILIHEDQDPLLVSLNLDELADLAEDRLDAMAENAQIWSRA